MEDSFYVTLTSEPDHEFPNNTATQFQKRIDNIELKEGTWLVGMTSLFLPDASFLTQSLNGFASNTPLMHFEWNEFNDKPGQVVGNEFRRSFDFTKSLTKTVKNTTELLHTIVSAFEHSRLLQRKDKYSVFDRSNSQFPSLTHLVPYWRWLKNGDLLMDNTHTNLGSFSPHVYIDKSFAIKMGWLRELHRSFILGPNLHFTTLKNSEQPADNRQRYAWDLHSEWIDKGWGSRARDSYWGIAHNNKMYLSIAVNWTFVIHSDPSLHDNQYVQIRSNLVQSSIFNNTRINVLVEVIYKRDNSGMRYIEPRHIRYTPVRQPLLDIIEIELYDLLGKRLQLQGERSSITLHFKPPP